MSQMKKDRDALIRMSKINAALLCTLNAYLVIFVTKYVVNSNDTAIISVATTITTLSVLLTRILANDKRVRQKFNTCTKVLVAVWVDTIVTGTLMLITWHSTIWMTVIWMVLGGTTNTFLTYLYKDRNMSIYRGADMMDRENQIGNVSLIAGLLGGGIAILVPIEQLPTIAILGALLYVLDAITLTWYTRHIHIYMDKYNIQLCSADNTEE